MVNQEKYFSGRIEAKFRGAKRLTSNDDWYQITLTDSRVTNCVLLESSYHPPEKKRDTYYTHTAKVRLYEGEIGSSMQEIVLHDVWIKNAIIRKTYSGGDGLFGIIEGDLFATKEPPPPALPPPVSSDSTVEEKKNYREKKRDYNESQAKIRRQGYIDNLRDNSSYGASNYFSIWSAFSGIFSFFTWPLRWFFNLFFSGGNGCFISIFRWLIFALYFWFMLTQFKSCVSSLGGGNTVSEEDFESTEQEEDTYDYNQEDSDVEEQDKPTEGGDLPIQADNEGFDCEEKEVANWNWRDYRNNSYSAKMAYCTENIGRAADVRSQSERSFDILYSKMIRNDISSLEGVISEYKRIAKENNLNKKEVADMVVSSVQTLEYYIVHPLNHREYGARSNYQFYNEYCKRNKCIQRVNEMGVLSPLEFVDASRGDCDSRTVFLYSVLKSLNINVKVLNSNSHSMLGVNGIKPDGNDFIKIAGKRYYFWETTSYGFKLGQFPKGGESKRNFKPSKIR